MSLEANGTIKGTSYTMKGKDVRPTGSFDHVKGAIPLVTGVEFRYDELILM